SAPRHVASRPLRRRESIAPRARLPALLPVKMPRMRFPVRPAAAMAAALALLPACEKDVVLPDVETAPVCGNGILKVGGQCDLQSPGCVQCMVVPGFSCDSKSCVELCEDGLVGNNGVCDHRDSQCDMTGYWAARETDYTRDT